MTPPTAFDGAEFRRIADVVERLESHAVPHIGLREAVSALRHAATLADELARLREIEHLVWHLMDDSEDRDAERILDNKSDDLKKLFELLPEEHPKGRT